MAFEMVTPLNRDVTRCSIFERPPDLIQAWLLRQPVGNQTQIGSKFRNEVYD